MAVTSVNSEDRLVQATFAAHLEEVLGWESVYAWNDEIFEPGGTLGRASPNEAVLTRDLRAALVRLNPDLPIAAIEDVLRALTVHDFSRSMVQHNQDFAQLIPVADGRRPAMAERRAMTCMKRRSGKSDA